MSEPLSEAEQETLDLATVLYGLVTQAEADEATHKAVEQIVAARTQALEAERDRLHKGIEALLADGPDTWTPYDSRDTGQTFLAESVLDFTGELRALLGGEA